jgi:hypothetical protein
MESTDQTTQQLMFSLIEIWKGSGLSQIAFCKEKDIAYHRFHYWFKKYNDLSGSVSASPSFSQVSVSSLTPTIGTIEVIYPDGRKIIFRQSVEVSFLRTLLA